VPGLAAHLDEGQVVTDVADDQAAGAGIDDR
jgi:hypothetical protein